MLSKLNTFAVRYLRADRVLQYLPAYKHTIGKMHSKPQIIQKSNISIHILPALQDNYMYMVIDNSTKEAVVVDPADAKTVISYLSQNPDITLKAVLATHHHWDHVGGVLDLLKNLEAQNPKNKIPVFGGDSRCDGITKIIDKSDPVVKITENLKFDVHFTPCHTQGHVCFYHSDSKIVFTGDTLFIGGCGRFFEGTAPEMNIALNKKLASLPDETDVFCGHEYTLSNLKFALHVEPDNENLEEYFKECEGKRLENKPTIPGKIGKEKEINPFMRVASSESLIKLAKDFDDSVETSDDVMRVIREMKDTFK